MADQPSGAQLCFELAIEGALGLLGEEPEFSAFRFAPSRLQLSSLTRGRVNIVQDPDQRGLSGMAVVDGQSMRSVGDPQPPELASSTDPSGQDDSQWCSNIPIKAAFSKGRSPVGCGGGSAPPSVGFNRILQLPGNCRLFQVSGHPHPFQGGRQISFLPELDARAQEVALNTLSLSGCHARAAAARRQQVQ